ATGEEVYSLAIILKEEGIYDRATIFATDYNDHVLEIAKEGIYPIKNVKKFTPNYQKTKGTRSFSEYFQFQNESVIINRSLKKNITFANHNMVTDSVFSEMHLILCRNVLIYFNRELQNQVLRLFTDSLIFKGFLCLGNKESLEFTSVKDRFKVSNKKEKIYRKVVC
ncbi:MAG: CheR family methyltransferase, partial [Candidatus Anammoxibacter sp.]